MPGWLAVMFGGALGALARYGVALAALRLGSAFPWGTWIANMAGCLLIGALLPLAMEAKWAEPVRLFVLTGFLGAFTTFSTFSYETFALWERGQIGAAALYALGSLVLGFAGVAVGYGITTRVLG